MALQLRTAVAMASALALSACIASPHREQELTGADLYQRLCSSCHGAQGHGDGPVASVMKVDVPDLTRIAHRDGGEFPAEDIRRVIDGRWTRMAHGSREMPVWGWRLYDISSTDEARERAEVDSMIDRLVGYLQSIQRP